MPPAPAPAAWLIFLLTLPLHLPFPLALPLAYTLALSMFSRFCAAPFALLGFPLLLPLLPPLTCALALYILNRFCTASQYSGSPSPVCSACSTLCSSAVSSPND